MNNKYTQALLDKKKWLESESAGYDKSGDMDYCEYCDHQTPSGDCEVNQVYRETISTCATAYNRLKRSKKK